MPESAVNPMLVTKFQVSPLVQPLLYALRASAPVLTSPPTIPTPGINEATEAPVDIQSKAFESATVPVGS